MLLSRRHPNANLSEDTTTVHNYYERLVTDAIILQDSRAASDPDFLADVSCVALNHLPPRYIRHDVDMSFYLSPVELEEINDKVNKSVRNALEYVLSREKNKTSDSSDEGTTSAE